MTTFRKLDTVKEQASVLIEKLGFIFHIQGKYKESSTKRIYGN